MGVDPGGTVGELTFGEDLDTSGGTWLIDLVEGPGFGVDHIVVDGHLTLGSATLSLALDVGELQAGHVYTIASYGTLSGTFLGLSDGAFVTPDYRIHYGDGTNGAITLTAVPEPATVGLLSLALAGVYFRRRKKRG